MCTCIKTIEVYDLQGNPQIKYHLDIESLDFTVDEEQNEIYAFGEDEDFVLMYDLN